MERGYKISFKEISHLSKDPIFFQQKARIGRRGQQSPTKEGSGGNSSGISRILLKNISCPKKEWKNEPHNSSFHSKQICYNTKLQNGNSEKSQKFSSPQQLGFFIGSDRCLFACLHTSWISQISPFCFEGQNFPIQSSIIWSANEPICVYSSHESNSISPSQKSYYPSSLPRQQVIKKPKSSNSIGTQTIHHWIDCKSGTDNQSREVRPDSFSEILFWENSMQQQTCNSRETPSQTIKNLFWHSGDLPPNQDNTQYLVSSQLVEQSSNLSKRCSLFNCTTAVRASDPMTASS